VIPILALAAASLLVVASTPAAKEGLRASALCLECHTGQDSSMAATAHRVVASGADSTARVACTDCHGSDRRHWEEDPKQFPMVHPGHLDAKAEARLCSTCHENSHQQNMQERNVHAANDVSCSACHSVHASRDQALLRQPETKLCYGCHADVAGQFARPYRHPVNDRILKCSDCHMTLDVTRRPLSRDGTNVCFKCHAELAGPFPFEHPATLDFSTEEGGCISCHDPHGSSLPRMLKQPYEPPRFQLCRQCHSIPGHGFNPMHGTAWAGKPCSDCHVDIHGSYVSQRFFSESLLSQGCFNAGCHRF